VSILDREAQTNLIEYISRLPVYLTKILYEPLKAQATSAVGVTSMRFFFAHPNHWGSF
jgi:hypothetical protein